ncbi:MAG: flagellar basal body protein FliL [Gammaproteobacteria bacterium]|nr:MAG: flagellar basal body protein FliL [Gammaproteobacteria bacterium]
MAEEQTQEARASSSKGMLFWVMVVMFLSVGTSIAVTLYLTGASHSAAPAKEHGDKPESHAKAAHRKPLYVVLDPPFVVNFEAQGVLRFLQVGIAVMTYDPDAAEAIKVHIPRIRNDIILLLTAQSFETLGTPEGKQKIRRAILQQIRQVVPGVEEVYFTSFVMQ